MKITDMNLTIGCRDSEGQLIDMEYLLALMEQYQISHGVCYHQHAKLDPKEGNGKMAALAAKTGGKVGVCAVLDPVLGAENLPGTGTLTERLSAFKPEALRVYPDDCRIPFHPFYWEEILDAANTLGLPLILDCGYTPEFWCRMPDMAAQYPDIKFVLLRQGCCGGRAIFPLLQNRKNVYFTMERMTDHLQIEEIAEKCGCDGLLFGSGYPERPHAGALGLALYADISAADREKILYKNWEGILV